MAAKKTESQEVVVPVFGSPPDGEHFEEEQETLEGQGQTNGEPPDGEQISTENLEEPEELEELEIIVPLRKRLPPVQIENAKTRFRYLGNLIGVRFVLDVGDEFE